MDVDKELERIKQKIQEEELLKYGVFVSSLDIKTEKDVNASPKTNYQL